MQLLWTDPGFRAKALLAQAAGRAKRKAGDAMTPPEQQKGS